MNERRPAGRRHNRGPMLGVTQPAGRDEVDVAQVAHGITSACADHVDAGRPRGVLQRRVESGQPASPGVGRVQRDGVGHPDAVLGTGPGQPEGVPLGERQDFQSDVVQCGGGAVVLVRPGGVHQ